MKTNTSMKLLSLIIAAFQISCKKENYNKNSDFKNIYSNFSSVSEIENSFSNEKMEQFKSVLLPFEDLELIEDKILYLQIHYNSLKLKIEKIENLKKEEFENKIKWRITATVYPEGFKEFLNFEELNADFQTRIYNLAKADDNNNYLIRPFFYKTKQNKIVFVPNHMQKGQAIINLEEKYNVKINRIQNDNTFYFELARLDSNDKLYFEDFFSLQKAIENGYRMTKENSFDTFHRLLRLRSPYSIKEITPPVHSKNPMVIDGFDDLASGLENSGLPKHITSLIQSTLFYPSFTIFVNGGAEGASEQLNASKIELKNLLNERFEKEFLLAQKITEMRQDSLEIPDGISEIYLKNINLKIEILKSLSKITKNKDKISYQNTLKFIKEKLLNLNKEEIKLFEKDQILKININEIKNKKILDNLNLIKDFNFLNPSEKERTEIENLFVELNETKKLQMETISTYYENKYEHALVAGAMESMKYGMIFLEAKALLNLSINNSSSSNIIVPVGEQLSNYLGITAEAFLAAGQAEMVLMGLRSIGENIDEYKSVSEWLRILRKSEIYDDINLSKLAPETQKNLKNVKKILDQSFQHRKMLIVGKIAGDISLTAGQFLMLIGGPYGISSDIAYATTKKIFSVTGASATIFGTISKQFFEQILESKYNFEDADPESYEAKISKGLYDNPLDDNYTKVAKRIQKLHFLSEQRAIDRVWLKIYANIEKNPLKDLNKIILKTKASFLAHNNYQLLYLNAIEKIFPTLNFSLYNENIKYLEKAKEILLKAKENKISHVKFQRYVMEHLVQINENRKTFEKVVIEKRGDENAPLAAADNFSLSAEEIENKANDMDFKDEITSILRYSEILGFEKELEEKIVSRVLKNDGDLFQLLADGAPFKQIEHITQEKIKYLKEYIQVIEVKKIDKKKKIHPLTGFTSIAKIFSDYYMPGIQIKDKNKKHYINIAESKKEYIYTFSSQKFKENLKKMDTNQLSKEQNNVLKELVHAIFVEPKDEKFNHFNKDTRSPVKKMFDGVLTDMIRKNALAPILNQSKNEIELYDFISKFNRDNLDLSDLNKSQIKQKTAKIAQRIVRGMSHANVSLNFFYTPATIKSIYSGFNQGNYMSASKELAATALDYSDLALDLIRTKPLLKTNPSLYSKLGGAQVIVNGAASVLSIWNGAEQIKLGQKASGEEKVDHYVNAGFAFASGASSLGTMLLVPKFSAAGPVGTAVGFTILTAQNIYSTVRLDQKLASIGVDKDTRGLISLRQILSFGLDTEYDKLPKVESSQHIYNTSQKYLDLLDSFNKNSDLSNVYFTKVYFPEIKYNMPYTHEAKVTEQLDDGRVHVYTEKGNLIKENVFLCAHHNVYPANLNSSHLNFILQNSSKFKFKKYPKLKAVNTEKTSYFKREYIDPSIYCNDNSESSFAPMRFLEIKNKNDKRITTKNNSHLYYIGHEVSKENGKSFSYIQAQNYFKNFYLINNNQYGYQLNGGNLEDFFEVRGYLIDSQNSTLNGNDGIDSVSFEFLDNDNNIILPSDKEIEHESKDLKIAQFGKIYNQFLNNELNISDEQISASKLPRLEKIENIFGSTKKDIIIASSSNNFISGNNGNDLLFAGAGNDVLNGGQGKDILIGGVGNDIFTLNKIDFINQLESYDIIKIRNNYLTENALKYSDGKDQDIIISDLENLGVYRDELDLWIVSKDPTVLKTHKLDSNTNFKIAKIERFFDKTNDASYSLPSIYSKEGFLYSFNINDITQEVTWLEEITLHLNVNINEADIKSNSKPVKSYIDQLYLSSGLDLNKKEHYKTFKNVVGTMKTDIVIGNEQDNFINGVIGSDVLIGNKGDDILVATLDLNNYSTQTLLLDGGEGEDYYFIKLENQFKYFDRDGKYTPKIYVSDLPAENNTNININFTNFHDIAYVKYTNGVLYLQEKYYSGDRHPNKNILEIHLMNGITPNVLRIVNGDKTYQLKINEYNRIKSESYYWRSIDGLFDIF